MEQVARGEDEGNSKDEKTEPLSEVRRSLSYHFVSFLFRKIKIALLLLQSIRKRANLQKRWLK